MRSALFQIVTLALVQLLSGQDSGISTPLEAKARKHLVLDMPGFELGDATKAARPCVSARDGQDILPVPLAPQMARLHGISPLLSWAASTRGTAFEIVVRDEQGRELLRHAVNSAEYRLPYDPATFAPQHRYFWSLQTSSAVTDTAVCVVGFQVISPKERRQVDLELASISSDDRYVLDLVRAQVLANHRLWYDAIGAYTDIIRRYPDHAEPYERRGAIFAQIDATRSLSDADFARADALKASGKQ